MTPEGGEQTAAGTLVGELEHPPAPSTGLDSVEADRFEAVVRRSSQRLVQMLDAVFLDRQLAADAAQDAYVQLYLHWDRVGRSIEPEAWVYRVAVNRCKDHRRRVARGARLLRRLVAVDPPTFEESWVPPADFFTVLRELPTRQRIAAALFYQADMSVAETARVMGISEGAVNSHLNRARRTLKGTLEAKR